MIYMHRLKVGSCYGFIDIDAGLMGGELVGGGLMGGWVVN